MPPDKSMADTKINIHRIWAIFTDLITIPPSHRIAYGFPLPMDDMYPSEVHYRHMRTQNHTISLSKMGAILYKTIKSNNYKQKRKAKKDFSSQMKGVFKEPDLS